MNPTVDEVAEVKTIISEGVSNAIIHGYQNDGESKVVVKVQIEENRTIKIIIQDYGKGIEDVEMARVPMYLSLIHILKAEMKKESLKNIIY